MKFLSVCIKLFVAVVLYTSASLHAEHRFTVLNLNTQSLSGSPLSQDVLLENSLSTKADVLCLTEVFNEQMAYYLYEALQEQYAYFYIPIDSSGSFSSGLFIASKYTLEDPQFTPFTMQNHFFSEGFCDFTIMAGDMPLGHLYTVQTDSITHAQLHQIAEKMQTDCLATEEEQLPFLLCGNVTLMQEAEGLIDAYFLTASDKDDSSHAWLLQYLPIYALQIDHQHTLEVMSVPIENQIGLLSTVSKEDEVRVPLRTRTAVVASDEKVFLLCKSKDSKKDSENKNKDSDNEGKHEVHGSARANNDGAGGDLDYKYTSKDGYSLGIKGSGSTDTHGNLSGGVEFNAGVRY